MAESTFVQLRIDNNLKQDAIDVLDEIGIDMPMAMHSFNNWQAFLKRIIRVSKDLTVADFIV